MSPNPQNKNPNSDAFVIKLGAALADLSEIRAWKTYLECEEVFLTDLYDLLNAVPLSANNYSERVISITGMTRGIKGLILRRRDILEEYKQKKEEDRQNAGTNTQNQSGTTYGHTPA